MKEYFTCKLQGGLGNQLFQVAAGLSEEDRSGRVARYYSDNPGEFAVETLLERHLARASVRQVLATGGRLRGEHWPFAAGLSSAVLQHSPWVRRESAVFGGRSAPGPPTTMEGYFQHPDYFSSSLERLVAQIREALPGVSEKRDVVAIHVRAGDYANLDWELPQAYFLSSLALLPDRPKVIVAARHHDALPLVQVLRGRGQEVVVHAGGSERADFIALAQAEHLVMSNSTFCWWAAVSGDLTGRAGRVVFPAPWLPRTRTSLRRSGWISNAWEVGTPA